MRSRRRYALMAAVYLLVMGTFLAAVWSQQSTEEWKVPLRAARKKNPTAADDKSVAAGKAVYLKECQTCHGDAGKGDGPGAKDLTKTPGDLSSQKVQQQSDGALFYKITEGRKPMASFEKTLTDEQRWQVVDYIRGFAPKGATTQPAATQPAGSPPPGGR